MFEFEQYHVEVHPPDLANQLDQVGLATITGVHSRGEFLRVCRSIMQITRHRDADPDGVTTIADRGDRRAGYAALSSAALLPHTDGSGVARPPTVLALLCLTPAATGGEPFLVDGQVLYDTLATEDPAAARALLAPRSAYFGDSNGHLGSVFEIARGGRLSIRLRLDALGRYSPPAASALDRARALIDRLKTRIALAPGQRYLVQNGRWLHGRTAFTGDRLMLRAIGHPLPGLSIGFGFRPTIMAGDEPDSRPPVTVIQPVGYVPPAPRTAPERHPDEVGT